MSAIPKFPAEPLKIRGGRFQVCQPLGIRDLDRLRADIAANGVIVPIVITEEGWIVDGHHRWQIASELGITSSVVLDVRHYGSDAEAEADAIRLNELRRHMSKQERNQMVMKLRASGATQQQTAHVLGVAQKTISNIEGERRQDSKTTSLASEPARRPEASRERQNQVLSFANEGLSHAEIAAKLGISKEAVRQRVKRSPSPEPPKKTAREIVAELADSGQTSEQISASAGVTAQTVRTYARDAGIVITADKVLAGSSKTINSGESMDRAVQQVADSLYGFRFINIDNLDPGRADEWCCSLRETANQIRTLIRQIDKLKKGQQQ